MPNLGQKRKGVHMIGLLSFWLAVAFAAAAEEEQQQTSGSLENSHDDIQKLDVPHDSSEKQVKVDMLEVSLPLMLEGEESDAPDVRVAGDAKTPVAAEEENALDFRGLDGDGLFRKDSCEGHRTGDQWSSSNKDNCICLGQNRLCYDVDCLPGSKVASGSDGLLICKVGSSKRAIAGSTEVTPVREKRTATTTGDYTVVAGHVVYVMDHIESPQTAAQLNAIQGQIRALDRKVKDLTRSVSDLQLGQQYLQQVILYGRDELRLMNILDTLAGMQVRNGQYVGSDIQEWADSVLSHRSDGIRQVLFNLLNMVKPQSQIFGGRSLFEIYRLQLEGNLERYTVKMPQKVAQVYGLIGGGYAASIVALRIKGRTNDIPAKVQEGKEKLKDVRRSLQNYVTYGDSQKISFPTSRSTSNYARMWSELPRDLSSFTLCLHMRSPGNSHTKMGLVSYAVGSHDNEILVYKDSTNRLHIWVDDKRVYTSPLPVWDGAWHVICITWRSYNGAWQFYFDGVRRNSGWGLSRRGRVSTGGTWILGQDQDRVGGGFDASQAFIGDLSQVNLWDRVLSSAEMRTQPASCDRHGNMIDWADTLFDRRGKVASSAFYPCKHDLQKMTFPTSRSTSNYVKLWSTLKRDLRSFTLCLHMRSPGYYHTTMGLVSYAVGGHGNEILVYKDSTNRLHIWVDEKRAYTSPLPVWDGAWHVLCTTWRSYNGAWQFYFDGVRRNSGWGLSRGGRVNTGGTWILGQDQDRVGGGFETSQAFIGDLSQVNLWDRVLSSAELSDQSASCDRHGNVIDWADTFFDKRGKVTSNDYSCKQ